MSLNLYRDSADNDIYLIRQMVSSTGHLHLAELKMLILKLGAVTYFINDFES